MCTRWGLFAGLITVACGGVPVVAETEPTRCFALELYYDSSQHDPAGVPAEFKRFATGHDGLRIYVRDVHTSDDARERLERIRSYFRLEELRLPAVYGLNQLASGLEVGQGLNRRLKRMLTLTAWVRSGCPHCRDAKEFLAANMRRYPGLSVNYREVSSDADARRDMHETVRRYQQAASSLPVLHYCNQVTVGFDRASTTGQRILKTLDYWSRPCPKEVEAAAKPKVSIRKSAHRITSTALALPIMAAGRASVAAPLFTSRAALVTDQSSVQDPPAAEESPVPGVTSNMPPPPHESDLPPPIPGDLPVDDAADQLPDDDTIDLPLFGRVSVSGIGMPLFTIAVGLIDGFNPCAMWVLLFLLSLLVNLHSRRRMLIIAGIFVLISGIAYFTFMAAWLHVYLLIGYLRSVQVILGMLGLLVGSIHIKDFFALHKGISLSIPESARPGLYDRMRRVVTAETMWAALVGVVVLAVLVNMVELLCTSGLPALYTNILTLQNYSAGVNYAYLALYNLAYMFDDGLMVLIAVVTLDRHKLQERQGRWLKLISGVVIAILGLIMIFRPDWLV